MQYYTLLIALPVKDFFSHLADVELGKEVTCPSSLRIYGFKNNDVNCPVH